MPKGSKQQQDLLNQQAGTSFGNAQDAFKKASSGYQSLYANPGYTPSQSAALTSGTLAPIGAAGGTAIRNLYDTAARTGNSAGVTGGADAIARSRMQALGQGGNQVATQIADAARQDRNTGLAGEASLYAPSLASSSSLYGSAVDANKLRGGFKLGFDTKNGLSLGGYS